jgi:lipopolysaccharide/colanic/teichoic acid biosynthesis glycosyltransferase
LTTYKQWKKNDIVRRFKIYPFKGELEQWYQKNQCLVVDLKLIVLTAWVILNSSSKLTQKWFKDLPNRAF